MSTKLTKLAAATAVALTLATPALAQTTAVYNNYAVGYPDGWAKVGPWGCSMNNVGYLAIFPAPGNTKYLATNDPQKVSALITLCTSSGKWFWAHVTGGQWDAVSFIPQR